ncbi:MAG: D-aminoacylase [Acidobacteriaceae bacterium]|nr:D-aminoacylase [Acidobacteriaceae bacterium]
MRRAEFGLCAALGCFAALTLAQKTIPSSSDYDVVIRNGDVIDGSGRPPQRLDVGVTRDRINFLGNGATLTAKQIIDASGLVVAPGFIDPHTHTLEDLSDPKRSRNDPYLMQGVTTVITGNDGEGPVEIGATSEKWRTQGIGTNAALYIGEGAIRREVMGMSEAAPKPEQLARMQQLVARGMQQGAIGMSTGLYYAPGNYASTEEIVALAKTAAQHGGVYDTHMRDESTYNIGLLAAVQETIRIGREAGLPVHISHIKALGRDVWGKSTDVIALVNQARAEGLRVTASQYPYEASGSSITASLVPRWAEAGGNTELLKRISDPQVRPRLISEMERNLDRRGGPDSLLIISGRDTQIMGKTLRQIAAQHSESAVDAALDIVKNGGAGVASFNMRDDDIKNFMRQDWVMTCSDGSAGHPRKYGTFPRKLRKYVFDEHVISLPFAIRSSTSLPAETFGLKERGRLKQGYFADIVVFDPATIRDLATYTDPEVLSTGVRYLLVNGKLAVSDGQIQNVRAGIALH